MTTLTTRPLAILLALGALAVPALPSIKYPTKAPAGGKKREYDGRAPTPDEKATIESLIACLKEVGIIEKTIEGKEVKFDLANCSTCLTEMLSPEGGGDPRLCIETGTTTSMASAYSGKKTAGPCDPKKAQMNIQLSVVNGNKGVAVSTLAHEWLHMTQVDGTEGAGLAEDEAMASWLEVDILCKLIAEQQAIIDDPDATPQQKADAERNKKVLQNEKDSVKRTYDSWKKIVDGAAAGGAGKTVKSGAGTKRKDDFGTYHWTYDEPFLYGYSIAPGSDGTLSVLDLQPFGIAHPLACVEMDGLVGPGGGDVLALSGIDDPSGDDAGVDGTILYLEVQGGQINPLLDVPLPNTHPNSLIYQQGSDRLVFLDTLNSVILELQAPFPGALPDQPNPVPWADPVQVPQLVDMFSLTIDYDDPSDDTLIVYPQDYRTSDDMLFDPSQTSVAWVVQRQFGAIGPLVVGEEIYLAPGLPEIVANVTTEVDVVGSLDHQLTLRVTDAAGLLDGPVLDSVIMGPQMEATMLLPPQPVGTFVKLVDETEPGINAPQVVEVTAWEDLGQGLFGTDFLIPELTGTGLLLPDSLNQLDVTQGLGGSTMFLFLGLDELNAPFKGGTLVPAPLLPPIALPLDPLGETSLPFLLPPGLSGTALVLQGVITDPAAEKGFSITNAIKAHMQ